VTELILVRHGESQFNAEHRWAGWEHESPLTLRGVSEAENTARLLSSEDDVSVVYSSPLTRARQTAEIIGESLGLPPVIVEGLKEVNVGQIAGLTQSEFRDRYPDVYSRWQNRVDTQYTWPGGEQRAGFFRRAAQTIQEIIDRHPHDKVVVVCHGGVIRASLGYLLPDSYSEWWTYSLHTASVTRIQVRPEGSKLVSLNEYEEGVGTLASRLPGTIEP